MKIYSWNVNGIRAIDKKGELDNFFNTYHPEILCIQETKAQTEQILQLKEREGYYMYNFDAQRKGYSGVLVYTKKQPIAVRNMGLEEFDCEGRYIELEFEDFTLINCYFPNSQAKGKRVDYKIAFNQALKAICDELTQAGMNVIVCGDYNVAHTEIDLKNPKTNTKNPGFLPEERSWMSTFLDGSMIDTFRYFHPTVEKYSWWSYRSAARERNIGWRIDYFCVNNLLEDKLMSANILNEVYGSDHCPVVVELDI